MRPTIEALVPQLENDPRPESSVRSKAMRGGRLRTGVRAGEAVASFGKRSEVKDAHDP